MKAYYYDNGKGSGVPRWSNNWGDIVAPTIVSYFSGSNMITPTSEVDVPKLVTVGSVMAWVRGMDLVWGAGIIRDGMGFPALGRPHFSAVRGPLTRERLIQLGHSVPEVYGDPALLYPHIWNPDVKKTHKWGVIPHYIDQDSEGLKILLQMGVKLIDICAGEKEFINQLLSVEQVLSSSLHGLVAADAYGIPNARIVLSNKIVGGDYKFIDYSRAVNRTMWNGTKINEETDIEKIPLNDQIKWDEQQFLAAAPWNKPQFKHLF